MGVSGPAGVVLVAAGFGWSTLNPHSPAAQRRTTFGVPTESPYWTAGLLPKQLRLRRTVLLSTSMASGSAIVLPATRALLRRWLRSAPNQQDRRPVTVRLPPTKLSS